MKDGPCPKCEGRELYAISACTLEVENTQSSSNPLTLISTYGETGQQGFLGPKMARQNVKVSAFVCAKCGFSELYTADLELLEELAHRPGWQWPAGSTPIQKVNR